MSSDGQYRPLNIPCHGIAHDPRIAELETELQAHTLGVQEARYERDRTARVVQTNLELQDHLATVVGAAKYVVAACELGQVWDYGVLKHALSAPPIAALVARQAAERRVCKLIGRIFYYGNFKAETENERELESLLRQLGCFYENEKDALAAAVERWPCPGISDEAEQRVIAIAREISDAYPPIRRVPASGEWPSYLSPKVAMVDGALIAKLRIALGLVDLEQP